MSIFIPLEFGSVSGASLVLLPAQYVGTSFSLMSPSENMLSAHENTIGSYILSPAASVVVAANYLLIRLLQVDRMAAGKRLTLIGAINEGWDPLLNAIYEDLAAEGEKMVPSCPPHPLSTIPAVSYNQSALLLCATLQEIADGASMWVKPAIERCSCL